MKLDVWVDFLCPYCYVSICTLDKALKKTGKELTYVHHSHQLAPEFERKEGQTHFAWMAEHLGKTEEEVKQGLADGIAQKAKDNGVPFHPEKAIPADTADAHRLSYYAMEKDLAQQTVTRLARGYYELGEDLNDDETLRKIAEEVGLGKDALDRVRNDPSCAQKFDEDRELFVESKIESIPHYVVNDEVVLPESKSTDEFVEILEKYA